MRKLASVLSFLALVCAAPPASAEIGTMDAVPAATLLLPYFEVDLQNPTGVTTLFSVNNASATAVVAHVTLWTDRGVPTFNFDVYLTGYDVQTINMRDVLNGVLPITADDGADPGDNLDPATGISNQGSISQDINFPGSTGPCAQPYVAGSDPNLPLKVAHVQASHTGQGSPVFSGQCGGADYGDGIARGYVTVDTVSQCNLLFPTDPGYFQGITTFQNVLWGDFFIVNPGQNFAQGDSLVHVEACIPGNGFIGVGNGAGHCPFAPGDYTFYGRYVAATAGDQREPLATTYASRFLNGGPFSGGTDLLVWRDTKVPPNPPFNGFAPCGINPLWFPLAHSDVVAFDEQENPTNLCFLGDNVGPAIGGEQACFPLATQRISTAGGNAIADDLGVPYSFGWVYTNLNHVTVSDPFIGRAQASVTTTMSAEGRYSVGYRAVALDNAITTLPGGVLLLP